MTATELAVRIKALAGNSTADLVGIAPVEQFTVEEFGDLGRSFGPIGSIIVLAQRIVDPVQTVVYRSGANDAESLIGAELGDALLRNACWLAVDVLRSAGHSAAIPRNGRYVEDGPRHRISYKKAGVLAGLGIFGRNQLLIHPEWGPWLHLRTVITDAVLPPDARLDFNPCEGCSACLSVCPSGALTEAGYDRRLCELGHGPKGPRTADLRLSPHGVIYCDECRRACPIGSAPPRLEDAAEV